MPVSWLKKKERKDHWLIWMFNSDTQIFIFVLQAAHMVGVALGSKTEISNIKQQYWSRGHIRAQEGYTKIWVQDMKEWSGSDVASLSRQISTVPTHKNTTPGLRY